MKQNGAPMLINRNKFPSGRTEGLLIVTPEPEMGADVGSLQFSGPILVVLPKWNVSNDPNHPSWGLKQGLLPVEVMPKKDLLDTVSVVRRTGAAARPRLTGAAGSPFEGVTLTPGPIASLQTIKANGWTPVITDETGQVVLAQGPSSRIFLLSDPDLLNTQGLANLDTLGGAVALLRGLRIGDGPVIFDVSLNGYKVERSPLRLMFDPPFLAVTLCLVAAMILAGLQAAFRFGPVRRGQRAFALGKEALTDNSAQLIRLARREPNMAPGYVDADAEGGGPRRWRAARTDRRGADPLPRPHGRPAWPDRHPDRPQRRGRSCGRPRWPHRARAAPLPMETGDDA